MPDLLEVLEKRWKFIVGLTLAATILGLLISFLSPRQYLSTATALPANSVVADKARIFNNNIDALYSSFGSPDELDRFEGTAVLDTIFIATAQDLNLVSHYNIKPGIESLYRAALKLKKNSTINKSAYGELKVKVWDGDPVMSSVLANTLMGKLQEIHQHMQSETNTVILQKIKEDLAEKQQEFVQMYRSRDSGLGEDTFYRTGNPVVNDELLKIKMDALREQIKNNEDLVNQYQFALNTNPQVLLVVENARPSLKPDKPRIVTTVLLVFFSALVCSFLLAVYSESKIRA